jgi:hypothetical protein
MLHPQVAVNLLPEVRDCVGFSHNHSPLFIKWGPSADHMMRRSAFDTRPQPVNILAQSMKHLFH